MNLILKRKSFSRWGIVSDVINEAGDVLFVALEHAYPDSTGFIFRPKLTQGTYKCVLGQHELKSGPVTAYEIENVPNHTGILFHVGNYNKDSDGCVLLGTALGDQCITGSRTAFEKFMSMQENQSFKLTVTT